MTAPLPAVSAPSRTTTVGRWTARRWLRRGERGTLAVVRAEAVHRAVVAWRWFARRLEPASTDQLARIGPAVVALRWSALSLGFVIGMADNGGARTAVVGAILMCYTALRTVQPIGAVRAGWRRTGALVLEVALGAAAVEATGLAASPYLVSLAASTVVAGFAGGLGALSGLALVSGAAVAIPGAVLHAHGPVPVATSVEFGTELLLLGIVGGYGRTLFDGLRTSGTDHAARVAHLTEINELLLGLHSAAERTVMPLDLDGVARWAIERIEARFSPDIAALVVREPATGAWRVAAATGIRVPSGRSFAVPAAVLAAAQRTDPVVVDDPRGALGFRSRRGLYAPLRARGELGGVLAIEYAQPAGPVAPADLGVLGELAAAVALAVDNARWLERIHTVAVEQERNRLARELHDHVGQSIAYLGFELDRLVSANEGRAVRDDLLELRGDVRTLVQELRDTLADLRADVTEHSGFDAVFGRFAERVDRRGRVAVIFRAQVTARPPLVVEREFLRVAQEAVLNAERHSGASSVEVSWISGSGGALLEVSDDGAGFDPHTPRESGYGIRGMQERADAVGAAFQITSAPGQGTAVRMSIGAWTW